jgi:membrane protein DedA with SNARE-associated domain
MPVAGYKPLLPRWFFRHNEAARRQTGIPPMAETLFQTLSLFFGRYGLWVIFFGVMLENAGLPVPGETVLLFAGFLAFRGEVHLWKAIITGIVGASIGDSLGYCVGRFAGTPFVEKYVRRFSFLSRQFDRAELEFRNYGHWAVFVGRFITGLRVFAGPLAGMFRMRYLRFLFFNFTGAMIWATTIVSVGFLFGGSWESLVRFVERLHGLTWVLLGAVLVVAAIFYAVRRRHRSQGGTPPEGPSPK